MCTPTYFSIGIAVSAYAELYRSNISNSCCYSKCNYLISIEKTATNIRCFIC